MVFFVYAYIFRELQFVGGAGDSMQRLSGLEEYQDVDELSAREKSAVCQWFEDEKWE